MAQTDKNLLVLFGGTGPEHEASLGSAFDVVSALHQLPFDVTYCGITKDGRAIVGSQALPELIAKADRARLPGHVQPDRVPPVEGKYSSSPTKLCGSFFQTFDCVLPLVHGVGGEDGALQTMLESNKLRFVGCGSTSSRICFEKPLTKLQANEAGIPTIAHCLLPSTIRASDAHKFIASQLPTMPLIVKPSNSGSSFGVSKVDSLEQIAHAIAIARRYSEQVLIEQYLDVSEYFVSALEVGGDAVFAACTLDRPVLNGFLSYNEKYVDAVPRLKAVAQNGSTVEQTVLALAEKAFRAFGCRHFCRIDIFVENGSGRVLLNEINSIPALARSCAFSTALAASGIEYEEIVYGLIESALAENSVALTAAKLLPAISASRITSRSLERDIKI
ncbi:MAG: hypothetical protein ABL904_13900 [Hyphomicrobiaceae bacterium]